MIQVNRIYLIFNRLVTKKFLVDTSDVPHLLLYGQGARCVVDDEAVAGVLFFQ